MCKTFGYIHEKETGLGRDKVIYRGASTRVAPDIRLLLLSGIWPNLVAYLNISVVEPEPQLFGWFGAGAAEIFTGSGSDSGSTLKKI